MLPYFPQPTFQFGGATISAFGILAVASILTGWTLTRLYTRRMGLEGEAGSRFARLLVLGGFFGAAAGAAIQAVLTGSGGFSSVGSLIGASAAGVMFLKITHRPMRYFDAAALAFPGAWIFFRAGCALAHDHRGALSPSPLAVQFPEGSRWDLGLLEMLAMIPIAIAFALIARRPKPTGFFAGLLAITYGTLRLLLSGFNSGPAQTGSYALVAMTIGTVLLVIVFRRKRLPARAVALFLLTGASGFAQPYINYRGVVNAASYAPQGLPAGSIARGSIFTIFGRGLGPTQFATQPTFPLNTTLGGVNIDVTQGTTTLSAIPIFVSATQVSAIMPSTTPLGKVAVRLRFNNQRSYPAIVTINEASLGLFAINSGGFGPAVMQNYNSGSDQPVNTTRVSAKPGQIAILWGTGLGAVSHADNIAPNAVDLPTQLEIYVGGKLATRQYAGRSPCCSGLDEIVFTIPADAPQGCYVPVQVRTNKGVVSNSVTMAIHAAGRPCVDSFNPLGEALRNGGRIGIIAPHRFDVINGWFGTIGNIITDQVDVALQEAPGGETWFNPASGLPPVGSCTTYGGRTSSTVAELVAIIAPTSRQLDGGASLQITGTGPPGPIPKQNTDPKIYRGLLGQQGGIATQAPLFFSFPSSFDFLIPGGTDVQRSEARFETGPSLQWTNRDQVAVLNRTAGLTLNWTGGDPAQDIVIAAMLSSDDPSNSAALAVCVASVDARSLTVPSHILASLPATPSKAGPVSAWIFVATARVRNPGRISGPGLDAGFIVPAVVGAKAVPVQ